MEACRDKHPAAWAERLVSLSTAMHLRADSCCLRSKLLWTAPLHPVGLQAARHGHSPEAAAFRNAAFQTVSIVCRHVSWWFTLHVTAWPCPLSLILLNNALLPRPCPIFAPKA